MGWVCNNGWDEDTGGLRNGKLACNGIELVACIFTGADTTVGIGTGTGSTTTGGDTTATGADKITGGVGGITAGANNTGAGTETTTGATS